MDVKTILEAPTPLGDAARQWVLVTAEFVKRLSENNLSLEFGQANTTDVNVNYDAPVMDSYIKTYKPITTEEIVSANKQMSEAIAGEKWMEGFMQAVQLMLMFAR